MQHRPAKRGSLGFLVGLCAVAISAGLGIQAASAQDATATAVTSAKPQSTNPKGMYYVDFRARTAASYGHAFVWFGRAGQRQIEVAGLHPATESVIPYIVGHVLPVLAETGKSYGDLDEDYLTASYRVYMDEAQAKEVFAYIKHLQATSPVWNAATWNCVAFIQAIASHMGLRVPGNHLLYPEEWVNRLRELNGGRRYMASQPVAQARLRRPRAPAVAARKPAASGAADRRGRSAHLIERRQRPKSTTAEAFEASAFLLAEEQSQSSTNSPVWRHRELFRCLKRGAAAFAADSGLFS